jgi:hypothetical protein
MAIGHHVGSQVAAIGTANRDGHTVMIEGPRSQVMWRSLMRARRCSVAVRPAGQSSAQDWYASGESIPQSRYVAPSTLSISPSTTRFRRAPIGHERQ